MNYITRFIKRFTANIPTDDTQQITVDISDGTKKYPFYVSTPIILLGLVLFFYILSALEGVLVPFCFSILLAILLNPIYNKLLKLKFNKILAIVTVLIIAAIIISALFIFISSQLANFGDMWPELKQKSQSIFHEAQVAIRRYFKFSIFKQDEVIKKSFENVQQYIGATLSSIFRIVGVIVLIPIYIFLILYYKPLLLNFIYEAFDAKNEGKVAEVLKETKSAIQSYVLGLLIETIIVAALNSIALLILGVDYAILIGIIGAILNLVPYIGGIIAIALPVLMATITKDGYTTQLLIIGAYGVIQFIDNNIVMPRVVSSKVSVNALASIISVLLGNLLWGVGGMFLSIPFVAVLKIVFDKIDGLKPWGKLLGTKIPK
ncbi:MAG: AI-2E family transporter [Bacteroidota bacterium]|nr:AI-2E family transporter [Bacteroidota bacterium]